jgi:transcriptional regulator with XRE-family HTH domain
VDSRSREAGSRAIRLRNLRKGAGLTQADLANAFSTEQPPVTSKTISTWENTEKPTAALEGRIERYARFFATQRSRDGNPRLIALEDLTQDELAAMRKLEQELLDLWGALRDIDSAPVRPPRYLHFPNDTRLTIICGDAPPEAQGPLAAPSNANFTQMHAYADLDALIELYGHVKAQNAPEFEVVFIRASEVHAMDLLGHVVVLGAIAWNFMSGIFLRELKVSRYRRSRTTL